MITHNPAMPNEMYIHLLLRLHCSLLLSAAPPKEAVASKILSKRACFTGARSMRSATLASHYPVTRSLARFRQRVSTRPHAQTPLQCLHAYTSELTDTAKGSARRFSLTARRIEARTGVGPR